MTYKPFIAKDTKQPLVVLGGYKIKEGGGIHRETLATKPPSDFEPTHHDTVTNKKVQIKKTQFGHSWVREDGATGSDHGEPHESRYKPLTSQHAEEDHVVGDYTHPFSASPWHYNTFEKHLKSHGGRFLNAGKPGSKQSASGKFQIPKGQLVSFKNRLSADSVKHGIHYTIPISSQHSEQPDPTEQSDQFDESLRTFRKSFPRSTHSHGTWNGPTPGSSARGDVGSAFHDAVAKLGGTSFDDKHFAVPHGKVDDLHSAARKMGLVHGTHYKGLGANQFEEQDPTEQSQAALLRYGEVVLAPPIPLRDDVEQFAEADYVEHPGSGHTTEEGHKVKINYGEHKGKRGVVDHLAPSGHFAGVRSGKKFMGYYHVSDLLHHKDNFG